jgi:methionyl-tRNA formyltransferase
MTSAYKIIFMGTPDFAVQPLKALVEAGYEVCLVVTQPDRPKGRGKKLAQSPVKETALKLGLEVFQPTSLKISDNVARLKPYAPDFLVVAAFGQILTQEVLDIPSIYPINIHASLLPAHRGASPIQASILARDTETGITTMVMDKNLDTGDILLKSKIPLTLTETAQELHDRLAGIGADLIIETLEAIAKGSVQPVPQNHDLATYAPMLTKKDGKIDWNHESHVIDAVIRAMTPWPGAFTFIGKDRIKLFGSKLGTGHAACKPGTILACDNKGLHVASGSGVLIIQDLQGASGKRMPAQDFLRGRSLETGMCFES